jgi:dipeptidyl aminopeptidase/acylaminoacyl peptidase
MEFFNPSYERPFITFEKADYYGFAKYNENIVAAYRDNIKIYNKDLEEEETILCSGVDPYVKTNGDNMLVFYPSEKKALLKTGKNETNITTPYYILNATVNKNGYYAFVTEEKGFKSQVLDYDNKGNELYKWHSADYYITDVSISDDNTKMVVTAFVNDENQIKSSVMVFSFTDSKPVAKIEEKDNVIISAAFSDKNKINIVGDKKCGVYNSDLVKMWEETYDSKQLFTYNISGENIIIAYADTSSATDKVSVKIYSQGGKEKGEYIHDGEITGIDVSDGGILAYSKRQMYVLSESGRVKRHLDVNVDISNAFLSDDGKSVFTVSNSVGKFYYLR